MLPDDIRTESHRLGELETAALRLANEVAELKRECVRANRELLDVVTRLDALEDEATLGLAWRAPWWRRFPWCT